MDGFEDKPINNVEIKHLHVKDAPKPYYLKCIKDIRLIDTSVNGVKLPEKPEEHHERIVLDVFWKNIK